MREPAEWTDETLGVLISLEYGQALPAEIRTGEGYPVIGSSGPSGHHSKALVGGPGIIVGRKGTVGGITWAEVPSWPIDTTYWVKPRRELDLRWLYWTLHTLGLELMDSSTGVPGLNREEAYRIPVRVPPVSEQRRIAEVIDSIDQQISTIEQLINKLDLLRIGLLRDIFTGLEAQDYSLGELGEIVTGTTPAANDRLWGNDFPFVTPAELGDREVVTDSSRGLTRSATRYVRPVPEGSLLAVCIGSTFGKLGIAGTSLCTNQQINSVVPGPDVDSYFLYITLGQHIQQMQSLVGLQAVPIVNKRLFSSIRVPVPCKDIQISISRQVRYSKARIDAERSKLLKLRRLKQGLMDDLLTGRVRVRFRDKDKSG